MFEVSCNRIWNITYIYALRLNEYRGCKSSKGLLLPILRPFVLLSRSTDRLKGVCLKGS